MLDRLIKTYGLQPHPEGGYYREIYRSAQSVVSPVSSAERAAMTHIYFLLGRGQVSRFHRVVHDEIWHHYQGDPIRLIRFDGKAVAETVIGPGCDDYTTVIPGGIWQAAETTGACTLVGCTVAPGFDFTDFSFLSDAPGEPGNALAPPFHRFI